MTNVLLPGSESRRLTFYLAMEEWVCENLREGFFVWQVPPTVIFGRNQDLSSEVNVPYCEEHGISYFRRKSGGGCVYSDEGNLMLSWVTPTANVESAFSEYLGRLCSALKAMGVDAVSSEHNDVLVDGRKVSGNAFFLHSGAGIVHGTLLYDTDFSVLGKAITPSREKLAKHAVQSVRQRVANLKELGLSLGIEGIKAFLVRYFTDSQYVLRDDEMKEIEGIEKTYLDPAFLLGKEH